MSVDRDPFVGFVGIAEHDVGRLAAYSRQRTKLLHGSRHLAAMFRHNRLRHSNKTLGLIAKEPGGLDDFLDILRLRPGQLEGGWVPGKQRRRDHVHPGISTLSRKDRGAEQFVGVPVVQCATGVRVGLLEKGDDFMGGRTGPAKCLLDRLFDQGRFWVGFFEATRLLRYPSARPAVRPSALHPRLLRAKPTNASTGLELRMSSRCSQPLRAIPTPYCT